MQDLHNSEESRYKPFELFKETDDAALDKNTYEIRFCE